MSKRKILPAVGLALMSAVLVLLLLMYLNLVYVSHLGA